MSRLIHAHPVERLVEAYLKRLRNTNKVRVQQNILTKASKMIGIALHDPCCAPAEEVILGTQENFFIIQLRALLNGIDVRKNRESLERAKAAIDKIINKECCSQPALIGNAYDETGSSENIVAIIYFCDGTYPNDFFAESFDSFEELLAQFIEWANTNEILGTWSSPEPHKIQLIPFEPVPCENPPFGVDFVND